MSSDNGSHFANDAITQIGEYMGMDIRKHCAYHPQSGGAVERENGTIKNKLAKCCADTGLSWTQALPIVLMYMRMRKRTRSQLSPFEILFGAPPQIGLKAPGCPLPSTTLCEDAMLSYCVNLSSTLEDIRRQVAAALPTPATCPLHHLQPGDLADQGFPEKELEIQSLARSLPGASRHRDSGQGRRESYVGPRQPLQGRSHRKGETVEGDDNK
ncbi:hypothetical protein CgunFtcFv8_011249 [Champsocephalus gunnari]|uniref:Integrase catalytic domain-containing protein n=1 Tax=Champsocephalus gunnari TaxID=52237 RepID=A0AAN8D4F1_CHAGU|nr:hypothetical protein CgunFtcFv8_011249 [Champsocephalus gunnari]